MTNFSVDMNVLIKYILDWQLYKVIGVFIEGKLSD